MEPATIFPAQVEHAPALQEYGSSTPAFSAESRMYVSAGASNSCSVPSGSTSLTLYTEDPDVLEPEPAFKPKDFETLFTDPSERGLFRKALLALARCVVLSLQAQEGESHRLRDGIGGSEACPQCLSPPLCYTVVVAHQNEVKPSLTNVYSYVLS
nr:hypothetical protein Iba_chr07bCG6090 [Ipomoea batatas]